MVLVRDCGGLFLLSGLATILEAADVHPAFRHVQIRHEQLGEPGRLAPPGDVRAAHTSTPIAVLVASVRIREADTDVLPGWEPTEGAWPNY